MKQTGTNIHQIYQMIESNRALINVYVENIKRLFMEQTHDGLSMEQIQPIMELFQQIQINIEKMGQSCEWLVDAEVDTEKTAVQFTDLRESNIDPFMEQLKLIELSVEQVRLKMEHIGLNMKQMGPIIEKIQLNMEQIR